MQYTPSIRTGHTPTTLAAKSLLLVLVFHWCASQSYAEDGSLQAELAWRYRAASGACEIAAYSAETRRLFVTVGGGVDVMSARSGEKVGEISSPEGYHATSVSCLGEVVAVAWAAGDKRQRGTIAVYEVESLAEIASRPAGYLPDMITFTPDGKTLLAANEGEPTDDYSFDPEASISIISRTTEWDKAETREAKFTKFNSHREELIAEGVQLFGPSSEGLATVSQDVEPEYIAVSADSRTAWITLQENNAIAELDIEAGEITAIHPLGLKHFRSLGNVGESRLVSLSPSTGLDASDRDGGVRIRHWPIWGMYQPDGIAVFRHEGIDYLVTANEGDPRDYIGYEEAVRVSELDAAGVQIDRSNPALWLTGEEQLGRLEVSRSAGDTDGDGDLDKLVCFGTRSFAIWKCAGDGLKLVFDSGSEFEHTIAEVAPDLFNVDSEPESQSDARSPRRGPEPENLVVFEVGRRRLVAIGLERTGGALVYDISDPSVPAFLEFLRPEESGGLRDLAPEGLVVIPAEQTSNGKPVLVLSNEGSGTMTAWEVEVGGDR